MKANSRKEAKIGWRWICSNRNRDKCPGMVNPVVGTFFEGTKIPVRECMVFIFRFVLEMNFKFIKMNFRSWRKEQNLPEIRDETICYFMSYCREICEVFASHPSTQLSGAGKTILVDEPFLTKRKYNRGRVTKDMTVTVLGIYCREDKEGLFFRVNGKSKRDIWPYIKHHVHPETSIICTDSAKQYQNVESMFPGAVHKITNHSKGEFVAKKDKFNTTNQLENENKIFKKTVKSRRNDQSLRQYMVLHYYKRFRLQQFQNPGEKIYQFIEDIKTVYPGYGKKGLELKYINEPTVESENIENLVPPKKVAGQDDEMQFIEDSDDMWEYGN